LKACGTVLAVFAIALHTLLWSFAVPLAAASGAADPFSVICHSGGTADDSSDRGPAAPASKRSSACDHCNLCSASGAATAPDVVLIGRLLPERVIALLSPVSLPQRDGIAFDPKLARGPPQQA
jgi:hypothetical protein